MDYLTGEYTPTDLDKGKTFAENYGEDVSKSVDAMRDKITELSREFKISVDSAPNLTQDNKELLKTQFTNNEGTYIRRLYELHLDPKKFSDVDFKTMPQYEQAKEQLRKVIQTKKPGTPTELADQQAELFISEVFDRAATNSFGLTPEAAARQKAAGVAQGAK